MSLQPASTSSRPIAWPSVVTVISAAILIGAEVFGAAFAGGWALAILFGLDNTGTHILQAVLFAIGVIIMVGFIRAAQRIEPFSSAADALSRKRCGTGTEALAEILTFVHLCRQRRALKTNLKARVREICPQPKKNVAKQFKTPISSLAQFRTCLWSCVSR